MTAPDQAARAYPVTSPLNIETFTRVLFALAAALVDAGYPQPLEGDMPVLAVALAGFIHGVAR